MTKEEFLNKYIPKYNYIISTYEDYKLYLDFEDGTFILPDKIEHFNKALTNYFCDYFQQYLLGSLFEYSDVPKCIYEKYTGPAYITVSRIALFIDLKLFKEYMLECFREYNIKYKEILCNEHSLTIDINRAFPYKIIFK